ncbi:MAG TPA: FAD-dependent thymidylate synthase [Candidatus Acidoferrales bacterium]|nr:FAD-dependent thymidylate synthase [Candidatus Acidoferrales bacterium]
MEQLNDVMALVHSPQTKLPQVKLVKAFANSFKNVIATARTCYSSKGIIEDDSVDLDKYRDLALSIYEAGHHTTFQHATFQFQLSNISRQFIWSFLHSHPFYNSEQVSQRYVEVKDGNYFLPPLRGEALELFTKTASAQVESYRKLVELLMKPAAGEYYEIFPNRRNDRRFASEVKKKAQEIARYALPVATFSYLYHTISGITLLRYAKMCNAGDTPYEQRLVVGMMVQELLNFDENYKTVLEDPLPENYFTENVSSIRGTMGADTGEFIAEFDREIGNHTSKLVDYKANSEKTIADSVREVLGRSRAELPDNEAISLAIDPAKNKILGNSLVLTTHDKVSRALYHASYTFKKKLSHTADSQDQRHRMTPASRPVITEHMSDEPDYILPKLVQMEEAAEKLYRRTMDMTWEAINKLLSMNVGKEYAAYLLPNSFPIRFTESADLLNLHHKVEMRLCYNAQEEIWKASLDEVEQIKAVHPTLGKFLLPPCTVRMMAGTKPYCPEGRRYCGVPVWKLDTSEYSRTI